MKRLSCDAQSGGRGGQGSLLELVEGLRCGIEELPDLGLAHACICGDLLVGVLERLAEVRTELLDPGVAGLLVGFDHLDEGLRVPVEEVGLQVPRSDAGGGKDQAHAYLSVQELSGPCQVV